MENAGTLLAVLSLHFELEFGEQAIIASQGLMQPCDVPLGLGPPGAGPGASSYRVPAQGGAQ